MSSSYIRHVGYLGILEVFWGGKEGVPGTRLIHGLELATV
jgi:hypothetical protein